MIRGASFVVKNPLGRLVVITICLLALAAIAPWYAMGDAPKKKAAKKKKGKAKVVEKVEKNEEGGFYGIMPTGNRIVYIVDNSNSMFSRHRFDAAAAELVHSLTYLPYDKQFYVILFSDTAYPVGHPRGAKTWLQASDENKKKVEYWLKTVELCLGTRAEGAIERALAMKADEIILLTDGAFTDDTASRLLHARVPGLKIHTVGLEVRGEKNKRGRNPEEDLKAIAKRFNGEYRYVELDKETVKQFEGSTRKKNSTPGLVWMIGKKKKKKKD